MYPPSIKFTVTYTKLKSRRETHKQESNSVTLNSATNYISFQFSVYSPDSGIQSRSSLSSKCALTCILLFLCGSGP